jgi:hypothetical protein
LHAKATRPPSDAAAAPPSHPSDLPQA